MRVTPVVCFVLLIVGNAFSCLWDRDTIRHEAEGIPDVLNTIAGRFDRFPPKYYEMRRDRILSIIETDSTNLELYDDLAVAYDRLADPTSAIAWMERKRTLLDQSPDPEHEYRYLANLGTFHAHRWLKNGADFSAAKDIDEARRLIKQCIELNPDAHFGREKYQLVVLEWLQTNIQYSRMPDAKNGELAQPIVESHRWKGATEKGAPASEAVEGFCGLITLGAAWESVDIFQALASSLQNESRHHVAYLAILRLSELREAGKKSLVPDSRGYMIDAVENKAPLKTYFRELRAEAEGWRKQRTNYIEEKLNRGEHPDTHPDFWTGFAETTKPPKPPMKVDVPRTFVTATLIGIPVFVALILIALVRAIMKRLH